jgi:hypothetical protein
MGVHVDDDRLGVGPLDFAAFTAVRPGLRDLERARCAAARLACSRRLIDVAMHLLP